MLVLCRSFQGRLWPRLWSCKFWSRWNPLLQISQTNLFVAISVFGDRAITSASGSGLPGKFLFLFTGTACTPLLGSALEANCCCTELPSPLLPEEALASTDGDAKLDIFTHSQGRVCLSVVYRRNEGGLSGRDVAKIIISRTKKRWTLPIHVFHPYISSLILLPTSNDLQAIKPVRRHSGPHGSLWLSDQDRTGWSFCLLLCKGSVLCTSLSVNYVVQLGVAAAELERLTISLLAGDDDDDLVALRKIHCSTQISNLKSAPLCSSAVSIMMAPVPPLDLLPRLAPFPSERQLIQW